MKGFQLPPDLVLGVGGSAFQIDGKRSPSVWNQWLKDTKQQGKPEFPCNHRKWFKEDVRLLKRIHQNSYYMILDWALIEPEEGLLSEKVVRNYRKEIEELQKQGISVMVGLYIHDAPLWFAQKGGWLNQDAPRYFERLSKHIVHILGDIQEDWITFHDPGTLLDHSYLRADWPGASQGKKQYITAARHMIQAHQKAYLMIHNIRKLMARDNTRVSAVLDAGLWDAARDSWLDRRALDKITHVKREILLAGMVEGSLIPPLGREKRHKAARYCDFLALSYFGRQSYIFQRNREQFYAGTVHRSGVPVDDVEREIHPEGMEEMVTRLFREYAVPVYIMANGTADRSDNFRARFIYDHLRQISLLHKQGVDIKAYYHWSLFDGLEWDQGWNSLHGLVKVVRDSRRQLKQSGKFYSEICKHRQVDEKMIEKFLMRDQ